MATETAHPGSGAQATGDASVSDDRAPAHWVLLKYGEIALRGRNRPYYTSLLRRNVRGAARALAPIEFRQRGGVLAVSAGDRSDELLDIARDIFGVSLLHRAIRVEKTPEAAARAALALLRRQTGTTFAIRCRRRDKRFPMDSPQLAAFVGSAVQEELPLAVDLTSPDLEVYLEVDRSEVFAYSDRIRGRGGLPVGSSGRAMVLFSGGIDSPVAAYYAMKRGLRCDFVHFSGQPFTGPESVYKSYGLVRELDRFQGSSRLFVVALGRAQRALAAAGADRLQVVAQRRLMVRVASALARREGAGALVTGDSLGQVSSQTLRNLSVVEAGTDLPILRPLIGFDKQEVVRDARGIGTLEFSNLPADDCCTLFASPRADTRVDPTALDRLEKRVDVDALVAELVAAATLVRPASAPGP